MTTSTEVTLTSERNYNKRDAIPWRTRREDDRAAPDASISSTWQRQARGVDVKKLTRDDVLSMTEGTYAALALVALRGAAKGRALARDAVGISRTEDEDTAVDAVERVYAEAVEGREHRSIAGRCYWAARTEGKRRAVHRIRETANILVETATDRIMPEQLTWTMRDENGVGIRCEVSTWEEVIERAHPSKRDRLAQAAARWHAGEDKNRNAIRDIRRALGMK